MGSSISNLVDNIVPNEIQQVVGSDLGQAVVGPAAFQTGGATGAALATGNDVGQGALLDLAGLGAGAGVAGLSGPAASGALGSGLSPTASGVTGLTQGAAGASGLAAAPPTGSALAPGFFAAESALPLAAGNAGAGTGVGSGGNSSWLTPTTAVLAAGGIPAALGAYGANQQARAYQNVANQYMGMGAPYRSRLSDLYNNPEDFLESPEVQIPIQQATNILARSLSRSGNPTGSGNALQELQNYASNQLFSRLGQEKDRLGGFGGLTQYASAAPQAAMSGIGAQRGVYDAIGAGAADIFSPPRRITLQDLMRSL